MGKNNQTLMKDNNLVPMQFIGNRILTGSVDIAETGVQELLLPEEEKVMLHDNSQKAVYVKGTAGETVYYLVEYIAAI